MPAELKITFTQESQKRVAVDFEWDCETATKLEAALLENIEEAVHARLEVEFNGPPIEEEETAPVTIQ